MPFPHQNPIPFTIAGVMSLTPNQTGCYGIFRGNQWVYVGRGDIRTSNSWNILRALGHRTR